MRLEILALTTALTALAQPASAQVANLYCAQNPAACQSVAPAGGYGPAAHANYAPNGGYGGYAPPGYGGYAPDGYGGYAPNGYGGYAPPGYGGYPPPGYYGNGGAAQAQSLGALAYGRQAMPGGNGQSPFPQTQPDPTLSAAPAPAHPANPSFQRYSAGIFSDANRPSKVVQRTARTAGMQDGYLQESKRIADHLANEATSARLDARYPFGSVMIGPDIVPPVVSELRGIRRTPNRTLLQTTLGSFEIIRQARVAVTTPNWRDYLNVTPPPEPAPTWTPPRNAEEQAHWDVSYKAGLEIGIDQARSSFDDGLARLDRDLSGMRRYHQLADQGAVSLPKVKTSSAALRIGNRGRSAIVGERQLQLTVAPKFQRAVASAATD